MKMTSGCCVSVQQAVHDKYALGARIVQPTLCCPVKYDRRYLAIIPQEILEKDYGCGDPSLYLLTGETVLDLGSGGGKICYIAAQIVGKEGAVIGVDVNPDMLALARKYQPEVVKTLSYDNVQFRRGKIQDLRTDPDAVDAYLEKNPIGSSDDLGRFEAWLQNQRQCRPLVADWSVDVVVSNCVLNLVEDSSKRQLFSEIGRVLRPGGRAVISDIVANQPVPTALKNDLDLWSDCISGAFYEPDFLQAFADAGFYGIEVLKREAKPWQMVGGIEFRSVTVQAFKGEKIDINEVLDHAVMYRGPWSEVKDELGCVLRRGAVTSVSEASCHRLTKRPYDKVVLQVETEKLGSDKEECRNSKPKCGSSGIC